MTATASARPSPIKGPSPSSPTTPPGLRNIPSTSISTLSATSSSAVSPSSNNSAASPHASRKPPKTTSPSLPSPPSSYGSGNCPQNLGRVRQLANIRSQTAS